MDDRDIRRLEAGVPGQQSRGADVCSHLLEIRGVAQAAGGDYDIDLQ
jgi:hypothetical protein